MNTSLSQARRTDRSNMAAPKAAPCANDAVMTGECLPSEVFQHVDPRSGLRCIVAIDGMRADLSTAQAFGGCTLATGLADAAALGHALRRARLVTDQCLLAGIPFGGAHAVLVPPEPGFDRQALFEAFGRALSHTEGRVVLAQDDGCTTADLLDARRHSRFVTEAAAHGAVTSDPAPMTAFGMFLAIEEALHKRGRAVDGTVVAIHGAGKIAASLCLRLQEAGAHLQVTDAARRRPCDVLVACTRGAVPSALLAATPAILVCAAPDACLDPRDVDALHARGVLSLPPELAAAGGLIHAVRLHLSPGSQEEPVAEIVDFAWRTRRMLSEAAGRDPRHVVRRWLDAARKLATARA